MNQAATEKIDEYLKELDDLNAREDLSEEAKDEKSEAILNDIQKVMAEERKQLEAMIAESQSSNKKRLIQTLFNLLLLLCIIGFFVYVIFFQR